MQADAAQARISELEAQNRRLQWALAQAEPDWRFLGLRARAGRILTLLVARAPEPVSRQDIVEAIYDGRTLGSNAINAQMSYLRTALSEIGAPIATLRGQAAWALSAETAKDLRRRRRVALATGARA